MRRCELPSQESIRKTEVWHEWIVPILQGKGKRLDKEMGPTKAMAKVQAGCTCLTLCGTKGEKERPEQY